MAEESEEIEEAKKPNDGNLANNYPPYDKVTRGDVITGRLGKDHMGGKKKVKEEAEKTMSRAAKGHQKYGKEGMQALAKAGKEGKDLDKVRNKYNKYDDKLTKEEVEPIDELSKDTVDSYKKKAVKDPNMSALRWNTLPPDSKKTQQRLKGIRRANTRLGSKESPHQSISSKNYLAKEDVAEAKDVSAFDWKSKVKAPQSSFAAKKISTGTVYTKKYKEEPDDADDAKKNKKSKAMGEGITQTIINHNDFVLEVTDNPTFKDYFNAIQSIVPSSNEEIQKELVTIATEAYNEGYDDIILESMIRVGFEDRLNSYRTRGYTVIAENYIPDADEPYVEYTLEKDGDTIQYVHTGKVFLSNDE